MRKNILLSFLFLTTFFISAQDTLRTADKSIVYIIRNNFTTVINSFSNYDFYNNDKFIGALKGFSYLKYECSAGKQLFWAASENQDFLELDLKPDETYIVEAKYKMGFYKGRVKLKLVPKNSDDYNFLKQKILSKDPVQFTTDEIEKKNIQRKKFILNNLEKYESKKKKGIEF